MSRTSCKGGNAIELVAEWGPDFGFRLRIKAYEKREHYRRIDVFDSTIGIAHESKVGYKVWSAEIEAQIRSDAWIIKNYPEVRGAHWHSYASDDTSQLGADPRVLDLLDSLRFRSPSTFLRRAQKLHPSPG